MRRAVLHRIKYFLRVLVTGLFTELYVKVHVSMEDVSSGPMYPSRRFNTVDLGKCIPE